MNRNLQFVHKPYRLASLPTLPGDLGISQTIARMEDLTFGPEGYCSPDVMEAAREAVRGSVRDVNEIDALFDWVKQNIEFRDEPEEALVSPETTLRWMAGDCDCIAMLLAAMAASLNYKVSFKTIATARDSPDEFSHVYAVVQDKQTGAWIAMDTTVPDSFP